MPKKNRLRYVFNIEFVWVTLLTLLVAGLMWTALSNIRMFHPIANALKNFALSDLYYDIKWPTDGTMPTEMSPDITIVDIGDLDRAGIAALLAEVNSHEPAVIGLDVMFYGFKDPESDYILDSVAASIPNLVTACRMIDYDAATGHYGDVEKSFFVTENSRMGYVNTEVPYVEPVRMFSFDRILQGDTISSLSVKLAESYIQGEIGRGGNANKRIDYKYVGFNKVACDSVSNYSYLINNRIVLLGSLDDPTDRLNTPIHEMQGVEVVAYIVQTLVDHRIIREIPANWYYLLVVIMCYITVVWDFFWFRLFQRYDKSYLVSSKLVSRMLTFLWMFVIAWITYIAYEMYDLFIPLMALMAIPLLSGEGRNLYVAKVKEGKSIYKEKSVKEEGT